MVFKKDQEYTKWRLREGEEPVGQESTPVKGIASINARGKGELGSTDGGPAGGGEQFKQVLECHASSRDGKERRIVHTTWENLGQRETHCTEEGTNQVSTIIRDP